MSQYDFQKAIALHWINPDYTKQQRKKETIFEMQLNTKKGLSEASSVTLDDTLIASPPKQRRIANFVNDK